MMLQPRPIPPIDFFNPRSIAVFVCILQGLIFAALLARRWVSLRKPADLWLSALLLVLVSSLITPLIGFANVYDNNQWLTYFPFTIVYSYGVFVWLYTSRLLDPKRSFSRRELLLFLPSFVYIAFRLFLFSHDLEWKNRFGLAWGRATDIVIFITELLWNLALLLSSIRLYREYRSWLDEHYSDTEKIKFDWLRNFLYFSSMVLALGAAFDFANSFVVKLSYIQYFYFEIVLALATYALAVAGYLRSQPIEMDFHSSAGSAAGSERARLLDDSDLAKLKTKLLAVIETESPHFDPQLTLGDLSRMIGVNTNVLSYVINNGFGKNFNDFVNGYRIEEVKRRLASKPDETMLAVAFGCGFNSKATFNRAFRKFTGKTPRQFQSG